MARKDISDAQVLQAILDARLDGFRLWPYELLAQRTGQHENVCYRAMERTASRGYIEYGTSLRSGWVTEKGLSLLAERS